MAENNEMAKTSTHIFMFPFMLAGETKKNSFETLKDAITHNKQWQSEELISGGRINPDISEDEKRLTYNEYQYFFPYVRDVIYEQNAQFPMCLSYNYCGIKTSDDKNNIGDCSTYEIAACKDGKETFYKLKIDKIGLYIFRSGVAVLYYKLRYESGDLRNSVRDVTNINEFGRRVFFSHIKDWKTRGCDLNAKLLAIRHLEGQQDIFEDFSILKNHFCCNLSYLSKTVTELLGNSFVVGNENCESTAGEKKLPIIPVLDDRMFVMCYYQNTALANGLTAYNKKGEYAYERVTQGADPENSVTETLYKLVFIDTSLSCQNVTMRARELKSHIYARWADYSTLYGVTEYSFFALLALDAPSYLYGHFCTMYFKMALLCLAQRGALIVFSNRAAKISDCEKIRYKVSKIISLQEDFIKFNNLLNQEQVSAQQQGIELYEMFRDKLHINSYKGEVENRLNKLTELANLRQQQIINYVLIFLPIISIIISCFALLFQIASDAVSDRACAAFNLLGFISRHIFSIGILFLLLVVIISLILLFIFKGGSILNAAGRLIAKMKVRVKKWRKSN